jgi:4-amino-4-deoxy-L-arabinose transferase-like glycosyltransferase
MDQEASRKAGRAGRWTPAIVIAAVAAIAAVLSILASIYTRSTVIRFDEKYYFALAERIASGVYSDGYIIRPPIYPLFLGAMFKMFGSGFTPVLIVQSLIRGVLVAQISYMGWKYFSLVTGAIAGILLAVYPLLIWTSTRLLNEILYLPLFVLSLYVFERAARTERQSDAVWAGVCSGLAALVRVTSFFFTFIIAIYFIVRKTDAGRFTKRNLAGAGLMILALMATISPWTVRNAVVHDAFIPLGNEPAFNLYFTVGGISVKETTDEWNSWGTQSERQQEGLGRWLRYVAQHPGHHLRRLVKHMPRVFDFREHRMAAGLAAHFRGLSSRRMPTVEKAVKAVVPVTFLIMMVGGIIGLLVVRDDPARRRLFLITVLYFIIMHTATVMKARYFLPIACLLSIYGARLIVVGAQALGRRLRGSAGARRG